MMLSITGDADCCSPTCQGEGCPSPARAASPPIRMATSVIATRVNRLSTNIVGIAPSDEAPRRALRRSESLPASSATLLGGLLGARSGTSGESWPLKPQFRPYRNAHLHIPHAANRRPITPRQAAVVRPFRGHNAVLLMLDTYLRPWTEGLDSARSGLSGAHAGFEA